MISLQITQNCDPIRPPISPWHASQPDGALSRTSSTLTADVRQPCPLTPDRGDICREDNGGGGRAQWPTTVTGSRYSRSNSSSIGTSIRSTVEISRRCGPCLQTMLCGRNLSSASVKNPQMDLSSSSETRQRRLSC